MSSRAGLRRRTPIDRQRDVVGILLHGVGDENIFVAHLHVRMRLHNGLARSAYYGRGIVRREIGWTATYDSARLPNRSGARLRNTGARLRNRRAVAAAVGNIRPGHHEVAGLAGVLAIDYADIEDNPGVQGMRN